MDSSKKYFSKVDNTVSIILWGTLLLCWGIIVVIPNPFIVILLNLPLTVFLLSVFFYTYYLFKDNHLHWRTGPFKGKVALESIKEISQTKSPLDVSATIKPSLAWKPLLIKYNRFDDLPVSPAEVDSFINELRRLVPGLKVSV